MFRTRRRFPYMRLVFKSGYPMKKYILLLALILTSCGSHSQAKKPSPGSQALDETKAAIASCKEKYTSHTQRVECSNPLIVQAYEKVHYQHMDLIQIRNSKNLEIAQRWDRNEITESQAKSAADYVNEQLRTILQERTKGSEADQEVMSQSMQNLNNIYSASDGNREYTDPRP